MIGKAKAISHTSNAIDYARKKDHAYELDRSMVSGDTGRDIAAEFRMFQNMNDRCENNTLSIVLSPQIDDGQQMNDEQLREALRLFIERMNLNDRQYVAYVHKDKDHKHIHLYTNRIDFEGKAYNDKFISNKASRRAEEVALQLGLRTPRQTKELKMENTKAIRQELKRLSDQAMRQSPQSIDQYITSFNKLTLDAHTEAYRNKQGEFQGLRFYYRNQRFKASEVHRSLGKKQLLKSLTNGKRKTIATDINGSAYQKNRKPGKSFGLGF